MSVEVLTTQDVMSLKNNQDASAKVLVAKKVAEYYSREEISSEAQNIAEDIFRIMVRDIELKVREALAQSLQNTPDLPKDVVKSLTNDIDGISLPFIRNYQYFSKDEIIDILSTNSVNKHIAVALRKNLNYEISSYIVDKCESTVVGALMSNNNAEILDETFNIVLNKYSKQESIKKNIVERTELPVAVMEKLVTYLSEELLQKMVNLHNLPSDLASNVVEQLKEKATLKISEEFSSDKQVEELAGELFNNNRLTPSLLVRSVCMGDIRFFEYALSLLSSTPIVEVRKTTSNLKADFMIRNLLRKAYIPKTFFPAIFSALEVVKQIKLDGSIDAKEKFTHQVIERILSYNLNGEDLREEDVQYLVSRII